MSLVTAIGGILSGVDRPGTFAVCGLRPVSLPVIDVDGVGRLSFPLRADQAEALHRLAEPAPYGRGEATLYDVSVRRCGQIAADSVRATDRYWTATVDAIVAEARRGLGVAGDVRAELYKLLLYREGDFFVPHRDTEKAEGMFGTLVVVLPSDFEGGELVVSHLGEAALMPLRSDTPAELAWAAFYADCQHELRPITKGVRIALVYNLVSAGASVAIPDVRGPVADLAAALRVWPDEGPDKVAYVLEHQYTPAGLAFDALKNGDAARAAVALAAAALADCEVHLSILSIDEVWEAYEEWGGRRRQSSEVVLSELIDRDVKLCEWRHPLRGPIALPELPCDDEEVSPPGGLEGAEPDDESFEEATGNSGATLERTYRHAVLTIWQRPMRTAVITAGSLHDLVAWIAGDGRADRAELASELVTLWPMGESDYQAELRARFLAVLVEMDDAGLVETFVNNVVAATWSGPEGEAIADACRLLGHRALPALHRILSERIGHDVSAGIDLLSRLTEIVTPAELTALGETVASSMPRWVTREPGHWRRKAVPKTAIADLLAALHASADLGPRVVETALAAPESFPLDDAIVPSALAMTERRSIAGAEALIHAALQHLEARAALPLEPPSNAARAAPFRPCCEECRALARFLADPVTTTWTLRARQDVRAHVEGKIKEHRLEVDTKTLRSSNTHSLECPKNQRRYDERVTQRRQDLAALSALAVK